MSKLDDLHTLIRLLREFDLPVSPILEYSINELDEKYSSEENKISMFCQEEPTSKEYKDIEDYEREFASLSVGVVKGKKLPHKAILLTGVMNLIEKGIITENKIELNKTIVNAFSSCWREFYGETKLPSVWTPFWYLKSEPFWHFKHNGDEELLKGLLMFAGHPSVGQMRPVIKYAYFDKALFDYMENEGCRDRLKSILIEKYIC